jgi:hypothetical protein
MDRHSAADPAVFARHSAAEQVQSCLTPTTTVEALRPRQRGRTARHPHRGDMLTGPSEDRCLVHRARTP